MWTYLLASGLTLLALLISLIWLKEDDRHKNPAL
jgi:hypothetical protein